MNRLLNNRRINSVRIGLSLALIFVMNGAEAAGLDLDDTFFRSGKYYVVVGVLALIFLVLFIYLIRLDRKVSDLEKN